MGNVHGDTQHVDVEQLSAQRVHLPIFQDRGLVFAGEVRLEERVVTTDV